MLRFTNDEEDTPCPIRSFPSSGSERVSTAFPLAAYNDDDDMDPEDLDFTRAINPPPNISTFRPAAQPRRRGPALKEPPRRITAHVPAHKAERHSGGGEQEKKFVHDAEAYSGVAAALEPEKRTQGLQQQPRRSTVRGGIGVAARRRVSNMLRERARKKAVPPVTGVTNAQQEPKPGQVSEQTRRALDDKTGDQKNKTNSLHLPRPVDMEKKQLKAPPRRAPLQTAPKPRLEQEGQRNAVKGRASGKENIPPTERPGSENASKCTGKHLVEHNQPRQNRPVRDVGSRSPPRAVLNKKPTKPSRKRSCDSFHTEGDSFASQPNADPDDSFRRDASGSLRLIKRQKTSISNLPSPPSLTKEEEAELIPPNTEGLVPIGLSFGGQKDRKATRQLDPLLNEDLARCEMYEESWLAAQESSISQLLNDILAQYSPVPSGKDRICLRRELLGLYSSTPFPLIYNRVHASLLYGALAVTQALLEKSSTAKFGRSLFGSSMGENSGWGSDLGLKGKFMTLFLATYNQSVLIAALEVIVGRDMFALSHVGDSERRILEAYLERYIVKSEDLVVAISAQGAQKPKRGPGFAVHSSEDDDKGSPAWFLRRTLLRSFMLILLLDKAKARGVLGRQCLFRKSSLHKSSTSILQAVSRLLLPFTGDASKPLSHLNYNLETTQQPLVEYDYGISNLAVDMRDGVRLTRLVEVFLSKNRNRSSLPRISDTDTTIEEDWPLTPHLHYPVVSRAQKLHNVSLALTALQTAKGNPQRIEAKDIVDGFREKTVGLLWTIVSRWGLDMLVDWAEVRKEIRRLNLQSSTPKALYEDSNGGESHVDLLQSWARAVATKAGFTVDNLTTSFGDGRVFAAIVNEYEQYLPSQTKHHETASLETKLRGIGCNSYFAGLFGGDKHDSRVYNQDFVVSGLAYLCSRILQPSIHERAAMTIQKTYRKHVFRGMVHRRIGLLLLAHDCAAYVNTKAKVVDATVKIQRAFRKHVNLKIQKLISAIIGIQSAARGMLMRRPLQYRQNAAKAIQQKWRSLRETRYQERLGIAKQAMIGFQAIARGLLERQHLDQLLGATIFVQNCWRTVLHGRRTRAAFMHMRKSASTIQRSWRRLVETRDARESFLETRRSILMLQAFARGAIVRIIQAETLIATMTLQTWLRNCKETQKRRSEFLTLHHAAIVIQRHRRSFIATRTLRHQFVLLTTSVALIKMRFLFKKRVEHATKVLQRAWRKCVWVVRMRKIFSEVLRIQSAWRGYLVRKDSNARMRVVRKRLTRIGETGTKEDDLLKNRTNRGLELLKTKSGFSRGLLQLELTTRYSRECAVLVATDDTAFTALVSYLDISTTQIVKLSSSSMVARNFTAAVAIAKHVAASPTACLALSRKPSTKPKEDVFTILITIVDNLKAVAMKSPQAEILLSVMETLDQFAKHDTMRKRLLSRKKWCDSARVVLTEIVKGRGEKKRGAVEDGLRTVKARQLLRLLGN